MSHLHEQIIRHALGLYHCKVPYRHHFVTRSIADLQACEAMTAKGYMAQFGKPNHHASIMPHVFWVTAAGAALVGEKLP